MKRNKTENNKITLENFMHQVITFEKCIKCTLLSIPMYFLPIVDR